MRRSRPALVLLACSAVVAAGSLVASSQALAPADPGGTLSRVSVTGQGGQLTTLSVDYGISPDGRVTMFSTAAPEVRPAGAPPALYHYLREEATGAVEPIGLNAAGELANKTIQSISMSNNADRVVFATKATNLDPTAPTNLTSVYLRDRVTDEVTRISKDIPNQTAEFLPEGVITPDGAYVIVAAGSPQQLYRYEVATGDLELVSVSPTGGALAADAFFPLVDRSGTKVVFGYFGPESDVIAGASTAALSATQYYLRDLVAGTTIRVSRKPDGSPVGERLNGFDLSPNGRYFTFNTREVLLPGRDTNNVDDVFRLDLATNTLQLVSESATGGIANGFAQLGQSSDDGRSVFFHSGATNLDPDDTDSIGDWMVKDMVTGQVLRLIKTPSGQRPQRDADRVTTISTLPQSGRPLVAFGTTIRFVFSTVANNLVLNDTNNAADIFTYDLAPVSGTTPTLSRLPKVGVPVAAVVTGWDADTTFSYQWRLNGTAIPGATNPTYTPTPAAAGQQLSVAVTGTRFAASPATRTSAAAAVAPGTLTSVAPKITGTAKVGQVLKATPGRWTAGTTFRYQWLANGKPIAKATKSSFKLTSKQRKAKITVVVTGSQPGYTAVRRTSAPTRPVV